MSSSLSLYIFSGIYSDYTLGMGCAVANSLQEAVQIMVRENIGMGKMQDEAKHAKNNTVTLKTANNEQDPDVEEMVDEEPATADNEEDADVEEMVDEESETETATNYKAFTFPTDDEIKFACTLLAPPTERNNYHVVEANAEHTKWREDILPLIRNRWNCAFQDTDPGAISCYIKELLEVYLKGITRAKYANVYRINCYHAYHSRDDENALRSALMVYCARALDSIYHVPTYTNELPDEKLDKAGNVVKRYEESWVQHRRDEIRDRKLLVPRDQLQDVRIPDALLDVIHELLMAWNSACMSRIKYLASASDLEPGAMSNRGTGVCYEQFEDALYQSDITVIPIVSTHPFGFIHGGGS